MARSAGFGDGSTVRWGTWWQRRSLRARLTAAAAVVIAAGMVLAATLLVWQVHTSLISNLDDSVAQQASTIADQAEHGQLPRQLPDPDDGAPTVQVVGADGRVVAGSGDRSSGRRLFTVTGTKNSRLATVRPTWSESHTTYRVAAMTTHTPAGPVTIYAALPTDSVTDTTTELLSALGVGVPALVVALALVGWFLLGRALRPVETLRRQAAAIPGTDLTRRLALPAARDELGKLARTFNELLARIETSSIRQYQFVGDAAHELRSPIASLRTQLEVADRSPDPAATAAALPGVLEDANRLSRLADDLLALARLDAQPTPHRQLVDLDDIVLAQARSARARGPAVDTTGVSAGRVMGDPSSLTRIVRNLIDNATRHASTTVLVHLSTAHGLVTLMVADDGAGIPAADRQRVFERFTRLDDARSRDAGGAGLGLAIVHDAVTGHDGTVKVTDNHPGARFTVTLPAAD